jgi:hypothetical protein
MISISFKLSSPERATSGTRLAVSSATCGPGSARSWASFDAGPGPTVLSAASDKEIVAAVVKLRTEADALRQPSDTTEARWSQIDYLILEGRRIQALQKIRDEFSGSIHDALKLLDLRFQRLRQDRPDDFADGDQKLQ